jgi:hypothetical protein
VWRQIAITISRRFCRKDQFEDDQGKLEGEDRWDEDNTAEDDPWDLQAGHGTHIAGIIYARELIEGNDTIISRRERFRRISQHWHWFLEFASTCPADLSHGRTKRKRSSVEDEIDEVQVQRWKKLRTVDIQQALKDMYGPGAQFRGLKEARIKGHYAERESRVGSDKNQRGKDVVVPDPGHKRGFRHDGGHHAIDIVAGPHGPAVPQGRDFVRQVGEPAGQPDTSADCHCHARVSRQQGIWVVFE